MQKVQFKTRCFQTVCCVFRPAAPEADQTTFFVHFQTFYVDFRREITEKGLKSTKKVENG